MGIGFKGSGLGFRVQGLLQYVGMQIHSARKLREMRRAMTRLWRAICCLCQPRLLYRHLNAVPEWFVTWTTPKPGASMKSLVSSSSLAGMHGDSHAQLALQGLKVVQCVFFCVFGAKD